MCKISHKFISFIALMILVHKPFEFKDVLIHSTSLMV